MNKKTKHLTLSTPKAKQRKSNRNSLNKTSNNSPRKHKSTSKPNIFAKLNLNSPGAKAPTNLKPQPKKNAHSTRRNRPAKTNRPHPPKPLYASLLLALHFIAIAVGISTILGTLISVANSFDVAATQDNQPPQTTIPSKSEPKNLEKLFSVTTLGTELRDLKAKLTDLAAKYSEIEPEIFLVDLDNKDYVSIAANNPIASASTIKLPILVALFQEVDEGKINLEEKLTMTEDVIGSGSGNMQYEKPGTQFTLLETATKMMTISDNTATNMLIERMGGMEVLNQKFIDWGLVATRLRNPLPDLTGTNTTSPEDLGNLLVRIETGEMISVRSRDRLLYIMRNVVRDTLLPQGLEKDALIAHKTGDIKSVLGDVGIIDMPDGKRYIAAVLVKRPDNDPKAKEFIQNMSKISYQYFKWHKPRSFQINSDR
ncbi:MAG: serine hydrolase [Pleurocapsa sp.]